MASDVIRRRERRHEPMCY